MDLLPQYLILKSNENIYTQEEQNTSTIPNISTNPTPAMWSIDSTKALIHAYKMHRTKVGKLEMRNLKRMWEVIANYLKTEYNLHYTAMNCENKWRVLERNYKKYVDNNNKTGRGRRCFEFADEFDEIFSTKKKIFPEILLSSSAVIKPGPSSERENTATSSFTATVNVENDIVILNENEAQSSTDVENYEKEKKHITQKKTMKTKKNILEEIRNDRKEYQMKMIELKEKRNEEKMKIENEKLLELRRKNDILESRNELLQKIMEKCDKPGFLSLL